MQMQEGQDCIQTREREREEGGGGENKTEDLLIIIIKQCGLGRNSECLKHKYWCTNWYIVYQIIDEMTAAQKLRENKKKQNTHKYQTK